MDSMGILEKAIRQSNLLNKYMLKKIGVFGSFARGEEFYEYNDQLNLNASLTLLANIGENVGKISEELKQEYQGIEWQNIKDFRNKIVHNYEGIDIEIGFEIITQDLRELKPNQKRHLRVNIEKTFNNRRLAPNSMRRCLQLIKIHILSKK